MAKILLVDDERYILDMLRATLESKGHVAQCVSGGKQALEHLRVYQYDLIVMDWMMPEITGIEVLRRFRSEMHGKTPVLLLTAKTSIDEKEEGLDTGADDYLTKPFDAREMLARVRALLRRPQSHSHTVLKAGSLELDPALCLIKKEGESLRVSPKVYSLLEFFMRHPNQVFEPQTILERVWPDDSSASYETLRTHIKLLRRAIDDDDEESKLENLRNLGYRFNLT
ncbi:MAG: response regulator transcription factor [Candidatus Obscuribacterales bacterium]|nr:response regulator transcription factor [Candidatus Obscuribacterales bacterium]